MHGCARGPPLVGAVGRQVQSAHVHNTSFKNYKMDIKYKMVNNYNATCTIRNCYDCELI